MNYDAKAQYEQPIRNCYSGSPGTPATYDSFMALSGDKPTEGRPADDFLSALIGSQLRYDFLTADTIRQLVYDRKSLRDKNRGAILGMISDVTGEISCCENLAGQYSLNPDAAKRLSQLQKTRLDLEKQLLNEDIDLWRDTFMLKRDLIEAEKKYSSSRMRTGLFAGSDNNDTKQSASSMGAGYMSGVTADYRKYS